MAVWVLVIDDDIQTVKMAGKILSERGMRVTALRSGRAMLNYLVEIGISDPEKERPDLILLDIMMPEMDGLETIKRLRQFEKDNSTSEIPVIFLTGTEEREIESNCFELGAADFIRKPFYPDVLLRRIENVLNNREMIRDLTEEATIDKLTGCLNKASTAKALTIACESESGALIVLDLDSFKLVNDLYGHEMGDRILTCFSNLLRNNTRSEDIIGRVGGDEFVAFCKRITDEETIAKITERINEQLLSAAISMMGEDMSIPLGISAGVIFVPDCGTDYEELFKNADKALYLVKQNGKHGYSIYNESYDMRKIRDQDAKDNIQRLSMILDERNITNNAMWLGQDAFKSVYRFMMRFIRTYKGMAYKVLITISPTDESFGGNEFAELIKKLGNLLTGVLRKSDIMMQSKDNQFFILLPEISDEYIESVMSRIVHGWDKLTDSGRADFIYETEFICGKGENGDNRRTIPEIGKHSEDMEN